MDQLRSIRIFDIAIVDVVMTWLALKWMFPQNIQYNLLAAALPMGVLFHAAVGIKTPLTTEFLTFKSTFHNWLLIGLTLFALSPKFLSQ